MGFGVTLWCTKKIYKKLEITHGSMRNSKNHKNLVRLNRTWYGMIQDEAQESLTKIREEREAKDWAVPE